MYKRQGLTALVVAVLFAISSFFSPVVSIVPNAATAPILIIVGVMMLSNLKSVDWEDLSEAIPAFFTSIFMGFSYSITYGIAAGFLDVYKRQFNISTFRQNFTWKLYSEDDRYPTFNEDGQDEHTKY